MCERHYRKANLSILSEQREANWRIPVAAYRWSRGVRVVHLSDQREALFHRPRRAALRAERRPSRNSKGREE